MTNNQKSDDQVLERSTVLLDEANILFDRFMGNIDQINTKLLALFQIFLVIVTIQLTVIGFIISAGTPKLTGIHDIIMLSNFFLIIIIFKYYFDLLKPKSYTHVEMFKENRFNELCQADKTAIVHDFIFFTRNSYLENEKIYDKLSEGLKWSFVLLAIYLVLFLVFLLSLFLLK